MTIPNNSMANISGVQSRLLIDTIVATVAAPLLVLREDLKVEAVNPAFYRTFHTLPQPIIGHSLYELGDGQWNIPVLRTLIETLLSDGSPIEGYGVIIDFAGMGSKALMLNAQCIQCEGQQGLTERLILIGINDVTAQKAIEAERQKAHRAQSRVRLFETVLSNTPDLVYVIDLQHCFTYANTALLEMWGRPWEACVGKNFLELGYEPWHAAMHDREIEHVIDTRQPIKGEAPFKGTHGRRIYEYIFAPVFGAEGEVEAIAGTTRDVTDRRKTEDELQRLALIVEQSTDFMGIADMDGHVLFLNGGGRRMIGIQNSTEVYRYGMGDFLSTQDHEFFQSVILPECLKEGSWSGELNIRNLKQVDLVPVYYTIFILRDQNQSVVGFAMIARDVTAQKETERLLIEARNAAEAANHAKSEFLANMSHEIRTPMNAVIGLTDLLALSKPLTPKQAEFIKTLSLSADSLLSLLNDLLDISKIEARSIELEYIPFSVTQIILEIMSIMAIRAKEKEITFTVDDTCVENRMFMGDPNRFRQIIMNLCSNAVKFTEWGGVHVSISSEPTDHPGVENVRVAVCDTGIGIAPKKLDTIFEKFIQADASISRQYGGTGLGLAITKTLVDIMGGTLTVESEQGQGSVFTVSLSLAEFLGDKEVAEESLAKALEKGSTEERGHVLLVEDFPANVLVATTFLEAFGFTYDVVENGAAAVEHVKQGRYIAVLMDVQMHGMNGFEATRLIREYELKTAKPRVPIIGMTAHALSGDRERCIASGMDDYIAKPFNPDELQEKLNVCNEQSMKDIRKSPAMGKRREDVSDHSKILPSSV